MNDKVTDRFRLDLEQASLVNGAGEVHRHACQLWNTTSEELVAWLKQHLSVPSYRYPYAVPRERFAVSLKAEVDGYPDRSCPGRYSAADLRRLCRLDPSGGIWYEAYIRGPPLRGGGVLCNQLYIGRVARHQGTGHGQGADWPDRLLPTG